MSSLDIFIYITLLRARASSFLLLQFLNFPAVHTCCPHSLTLSLAEIIGDWSCRAQRVWEKLGGIWVRSKFVPCFQQCVDAIFQYFNVGVYDHFRYLYGYQLLPFFFSKSLVFLLCSHVSLTTCSPSWQKYWELGGY